MQSAIHVITNLLVERFGVSAGEVRPDSTFDSLNVDSLVLVEMSFILGDQFDIKVNVAELVDAETIRQAAEIVEATRPAT